LQFSVVIFWQATGLFALAGLQAAVPPPASCGLPPVAASGLASLQPASPGCRFNPCLNGPVQKISFPATFFNALCQTVRMSNFKNNKLWYQI
jgi:hypothetical protein